MDLRESVLEDPEQGWKDFLAQYSNLFHSLIRRFPLSTEDREEIYQDLCAGLLRNSVKSLREWDPEKGSLSNYLAVITVNTARSFLRSRFHQDNQRTRSATPPHPDCPNLFEMLENPTRTVRDRLDRLQLIEMLEATINRLAAEGKIRLEDRDILVLRLSGLTYREIEDRLCIQANTQSRRLNRIKVVLQRALEAEGMVFEDLFEK
jgi:RNA polymerase sigma factor (sigma-70 family)